MRPYTFFIQNDARKIPSFELHECIDDSHALLTAQRLLARERRYNGIIIWGGVTQPLKVIAEAACASRSA